MQNFHDLIGMVITLDVDEYYVFDIKWRWKDCFCLGFRLSPQFADEKMQILKLTSINDKLKAHKYTGDDYDFLLSEFLEKDNYKKRLQDVINQYKG